MNPADFTTLLSNILTAVYTTLGIITILGAAVLWLLAQRFLTKKSFGEVLGRKEEEVRKLEARIVQLETDHKLLKSPMESIAAGVAAVQVQLTALTKQVGEMSTKVAVQEALAKKSG